MSANLNPFVSVPEIRFFGISERTLGKPVIEDNMFNHYWFTKYFIIPKRFSKVRFYADLVWRQKGCFKAIVAIGYEGHKFYVIKVWIRQTENSKFFSYFYDAYQELFNKYKVRFRTSIETNFFINSQA